MSDVFIDSDGHVIRNSMIDEHSIVKIAEKKLDTKNIGKIICGETNSNILTFEINRYYDNVDLMTKEIKFIIATPSFTFDDYASNVQHNTNILRFSWVVPYAATQESGKVNVAIEFFDDNYSMKTLPFVINVEKSLSSSAETVEAPLNWYIDIEARVLQLENRVSEDIATAVAEYLTTNPIETVSDEHITEVATASFGSDDFNTAVESYSSGVYVKNDEFDTKVNDYLTEQGLSDVPDKVSGLETSVANQNEALSFKNTLQGIYTNTGTIGDTGAIVSDSNAAYIRTSDLIEIPSDIFAIKITGGIDVGNAFALYSDNDEANIVYASGKKGNWDTLEETKINLSDYPTAKYIRVATHKSLTDTSSVVFSYFTDLENEITGIKDKIEILNTYEELIGTNYIASEGYISNIYCPELTADDTVTFATWADYGSKLTVNGVDYVKGGINGIWNVNEVCLHSIGGYNLYFIPLAEMATVTVTVDTAKASNLNANIEIKNVFDNDRRSKLDSIDLAALPNNSGIKIACFGDSITSNQVSNIGGLIKDALGCSFLQQTVSDDAEGTAGNVTTEFGNLAVGWSTMCDIYTEDGGENQTVIRLEKSPNIAAETSLYNVLSNQVRRLLQHTTAEGEQITWTVQSDGSTHSIDTTYGVGKGYTDDIPDIVYLAHGINDAAGGGLLESIIAKDDFDEVIAQDYSELKRDSMNSALRWFIETIQNVYPTAMIYVATPIWTTNNSETLLNTKCEIIRKMCNYMNVKCIDTCAESGINRYNADTIYGGIHPNDDGKKLVARYVAGRIKSSCGVLV